MAKFLKFTRLRFGLVLSAFQTESGAVQLGIVVN